MSSTTTATQVSIMETRKLRPTATEIPAIDMTDQKAEGAQRKRPTGLLSMLPPSWIPYAELMRLQKPAGTYAFYVPYLMGLSYAACISPVDVGVGHLLRHAILGYPFSLLLRSAACTWNDIVDQDVDRKVARTRGRPLARGAVSTPRALLFLAAQCAAMVSLLLIAFSIDCYIDAAIISAILTVYPFGKRFTSFPQLILGLALAGAIPMSSLALGVEPMFASSQDARATPALLLANIVWPMIYDTIYAHQDLQDDVKAGVKSLAVRVREYPKAALGLLSAIMVGLLLVVGVLQEFGLLFFVIGCGGAAVALGSMVSSVDLRDSTSCAWWFKNNFWFVGLPIIVGLLAEYWIKWMGAK